MVLSFHSILLDYPHHWLSSVWFDFFFRSFESFLTQFDFNVVLSFAVAMVREAIKARRLFTCDDILWLRVRYSDEMRQQRCCYVKWKSHDFCSENNWKIFFTWSSSTFTFVRVQCCSAHEKSDNFIVKQKSSTKDEINQQLASIFVVYYFPTLQWSFERYIYCLLLKRFKY